MTVTYCGSKFVTQKKNRMEEKYFIWDEIYEGLVLSGPSKTEDEKKKDSRTKSQVTEAKIYCPHKRLIFNFKETLNFSEQTKFRKYYLRPQSSPDVILLQDVKDLVLYLLSSPSSLELIGFLHLPIVDRFLRALILYLQHYLTTWSELGAKRAATAKRASNPLAGGTRVQRAEEMRALRCLLAREYTDLLMGCQSDARRYHHAGGGVASFAQSNPEKDLRIYEGLIQFAHRVAWIALERKQKELIEVEMHRLFRSESFNTAKRKCGESCWEVPEDERWILYGPRMPARRKIRSNSPLPHEILYTDCDYRILSVAFTNDESRDPQITYLQNALLAREEDLPRLGIKVGILGFPRTDFDILLIPQTSEDDLQAMLDDAPVEDVEKADDYETLMPSCGPDPESTKPFPLDRSSPRCVGDEKIRNDSRKKWMMRELMRASSNYAEVQSISIAN
ncbi:protein phosphatase 1 regulatory subunit 36-like [Nasonia vitripennis]|uniref:Uncharacterized protein n=1 Tax=Nasonia vitripennis TaxID=7425 RepID=A0A7M7GME4_NASVI|nr:protein phosphatase 1 regulatory subunit 36-like [Nasonia vitripennis]